MPLRTSIQRKAESVAARTRTFADTLLARRGVAAVIIALVAPLSFVLLGSGMVYASTLTRFATVFCGLTLFIAILVHGVGPIIKSICGMFSGNLITWNDTVLAVITLSQSAYFLATGYVHFVDAFRPYFYEITASSDADTVSQHRILVLSEFVFLTSLTYYWAGMNRMVHVVKSLEESYRNPTEGTIGGLVAKLSKGHRKFDSALRLSTIVFLLIIQTKLNLSLLTSMDSSKLSTVSTVKTVEQYAATATSIETAGCWFIFLSLSLLVWDWFIWWNAKKEGLHVPTPWPLHVVALGVSLLLYFFWCCGEDWIPEVPLCGHLAITFFVLLISWWQLIFVILAPRKSTLKVEKSEA